jgi:hypothetical protein
LLFIFPIFGSNFVVKVVPVLPPWSPFAGRTKSSFILGVNERYMVKNGLFSFIHLVATLASIFKVVLLLMPIPKAFLLENLQAYFTWELLFRRLPGGILPLVVITLPAFCLFLHNFLGRPFLCILFLIIVGVAVEVLNIYPSSLELLGFSPLLRERTKK